MRSKRKIAGFLGFFEIVQLSLLLLSWNVCAPGYITIGFQSQPPCVNINQSNEPVIIHCSITFEGVSVLPCTVYLNATCDAGEVYLTQKEFVFHYSETVYFDAIVCIDPETENNTQGEFVLSGYYNAGGIHYILSAVMQIIYIYNFDPDYAKPEGKGRIAENSQSIVVMLCCELLSLLFISGGYLILIRPRLRKYKKKHPRSV